MKLILYFLLYVQIMTRISLKIGTGIWSVLLKLLILYAKGWELLSIDKVILISFSKER